MAGPWTIEALAKDFPAQDGWCAVDHDRVLALMGEILRRQGKSATVRPDQTLQDVGFRSLDFSELVLRLEDEQGKEWNFEAAPLRRIATIRDVLEFLDALERAG